MKLLNPKTAGENGDIIYDIQLHNCGFYENLQTKIPTLRFLGRNDYHIIFVFDGRVDISFNGKIATAKPGDIVFFPPDTKHNYTYYSGENTLYGWLHWNGAIMNDYLKTFPFENNIYTVDDIPDYKIALENLHKNALKPKDGNEFLTNALLQQLLVKLGQAIFKKNTVTPLEKRLTSIISGIDTHPENDIKNKELAHLCGVSEFHFIRIFKEKTGLSPVQYQISARISKAKTYLAETSLSVSEIAFMCGFSEPLYFSRIFKSKTGLSPKNYRKII